MKIDDYFDFFISNDKLKAQLFAKRDINESIFDFNRSDIDELINQNGIKYGISEKIIEKLENDLIVGGIKQGRIYTIALGKKPMCEGELYLETYFIDEIEIDDYINECKKELNNRSFFRYATSGELVAKVIYVKENIDGIDIFGNPLEYTKYTPNKLPFFAKDYMLLNDNGEFYSENYGLIYLEKRSVGINNLVNINESMSLATITIFPQRYGKTKLTCSEIEKALNKRGVVAGIDKDAINSAIENAEILNSIQFNVPVAKEIPPINGENARLEYVIDLEKKAGEIREDGSIDYKERHLVNNVRKGETIVRKILATDGIPGKKVTGEIIPANKGKDVVLKIGRGVYYDESDNCFKAQADGYIVRTGGELKVLPVLEIRKDIDYETGNINFIGSVIIYGNILPGFSVYAGGNVTIMGLVDGGTVECGGELIIKQGINNAKEGHVFCKGNMMFEFCHYAKINCLGDIYFGKEILDSHVRAKGKIIGNKGKYGVIRGGECLASQGVEVRTIGSLQGTPTVIRIGIDFEKEDELENITAEIKKAEANIEKIILTLGPRIANSPSPDLSIFPKEKRILFENILNKKKDLEIYLKNLNEKKEKLIESMPIPEGVTVSVDDTLYSNVRIIIEKKAKLFMNQLSKVVIFYDKETGNISWRNKI